MLRNSFTFNGVDVREQYGLIVSEFIDVLAPPKRERKLVVPERDGSVDYGAMRYDERMLVVECATVQIPTRGECRALSLLLARKGKIQRWDEPDKYYVGEIYDPTEIERVVGSAKRFSLRFICEPFAYGEQVTEVFNTSANLAYKGTARTPVLVTITNANAFAVTGLSILVREEIK